MKYFILLASLTVHFISAQTTFAAEDTFGKLFSTQKQRSQLDALRAAKKNQPVESQETVVQATVIERKPVALPGALNMQGYVKRNDGKKGTVWINGEAVQERSRNKDVQVGRLPMHSNKVPISITANGRRVILKAGQVYDPVRNRIKESRSYNVRRSSGRIGDASKH